MELFRRAAERAKPGHHGENFELLDPHGNVRSSEGLASKSYFTDQIDRFFLSHPRKSVLDSSWALSHPGHEGFLGRPRTARHGRCDVTRCHWALCRTAGHRGRGRTEAG